MSDISNRLLEVIKSSGYSYRDLESVTGIPRSAIQTYASGTTEKIPINRLIALAHALRCKPEYIMGWSDKATENAVRIPVLGDIAAGIPLEAVEDIIDYEEIPAAMARDGEYFALRVRGDSMLPKFSSGDVVIVKKQDTVENGDIAVVLVNGDSATVKKVLVANGGLGLIPLNPSFEMMTYSPKEVRELPVKILGKVVELRAKF